ncbi:hypothetical protein N9F17_01915 [Salibacteraceae bacterium]|nr:hypothetical protein [Salibacteraceae bacterium]MDB0058266.1 hypothetical protein [Salibacteraceae bacterium]
MSIVLTDSINAPELQSFEQAVQGDEWLLFAGSLTFKLPAANLLVVTVLSILLVNICLAKQSIKNSTLLHSNTV